MPEVRNAPATSVLIPAFNEAPSIASVVTALRDVAPWREVLVVDDGSTDDTGARAVAAGARVIRHPYNKGNGAAVKTGIRSTDARFILIVDADGQHRAGDAARIAARLDPYDLVVGARATQTQASVVRRLGNGALNRIASYLTERPIPDLTSGLRAARRDYLEEFIHLLPNGFSTPTTTTLAFLKAGYTSASAVEAEPRRGVENPARFDGVRFFIILLKVITIFSPLRIFVPISLTSFGLAPATRLWTIATQSHVTNS
jgi:glycosyltransferase involved in cell wall biosynthesis